MRKKLFAIFAVSITAGTIYFSYTQVKEYFIRKLLAGWNNLRLYEKQITYLKEELSKLSLIDLKILKDYSAKKMNGANQTETAQLYSKISARKILERADLGAVKSILFST